MHDTERCKATEQYLKAAAVLPTVDIATRQLRTGRGWGGGEGAVGGVLPKRLKSGSLAIIILPCAPPYGRT